MNRDIYDINTDDDIKKLLNTTIKQEYYDFSNTTKFKTNNWFSNNTLEIITMLNDKGIAIWINSKGDICYRLSLNNDILIVTTLEKINLILSNLLGKNVKINKNIRPKEDKVKDKYQIYIDDLMLVQNEVFNPTKNEEFYKVNNAYYRNIFKPTFYLKRYVKANIPKMKYSIILNYINHLANYDKDRFNYIIAWLTSFFNTLEKSKISLVLVGNKESGINILFNSIIKPLFGSHYCIEINEDILKQYSADKIVKNKLFYCFNNISKKITNDKKVKSLIEEVIENDNIYINDNKNLISEINVFGQTLITTNNYYLPIHYNKQNYVIFKVNNNIEKMIIKNSEVDDAVKNNINLNNLSNLIKNDLENFSNYLKYYKDMNTTSFQKFFANDDSEDIINKMKDKYSLFVNAIINKDIDFFIPMIHNEKLYKDLIFDFKKNRIKRCNLVGYFNNIYKKENILHTKTLLNMLRDINKDFFSDINIVSSNGERYFKID